MNIIRKINEIQLKKLFTNEHRKGTNKNYQKFILLTYRRFGSNYFLDLLRSHPEIVAFSGIFEKDRIAFIYNNYPEFRCKEAIKYRNKYPIPFLNKIIFGNYSDRINAVGFKLTFDNNTPEIFNYISENKNIKIIKLYRKNYLEAYLSNLIAENSNVWHYLKQDSEKLKDTDLKQIIKFVNNESEIENIKLKLNYNECLKEFINLKNLTENSYKQFPKNNILNIYYEDLISNYSATINETLDFLGVPNQQLKSNFIKINNRKLSEVIINYDELKESFKGTEWFSFFND